MKIFGVFEVQIPKNKSVTTITFLVCENMVRYDQHRVQRCFDLKGSLYGRESKLTEEERVKGSGLKTLKDKNFIEMFKSKISIGQNTKQKVIQQMA